MFCMFLSNMRGESARFDMKKERLGFLTSKVKGTDMLTEDASNNLSDIFQNVQFPNMCLLIRSLLKKKFCYAWHEFLLNSLASLAKLHSLAKLARCTVVR